MKNKDIETEHETKPWKWTTSTGENDTTLWILSVNNEVMLILAAYDQYTAEITGNEYDIVETNVPEGASNQLLNWVNEGLEYMGLTELKYKTGTHTILPVGIKTGEQFGRF